MSFVFMVFHRPKPDKVDALAASSFFLHEAGV
jgi:hypothetical protein